MSTYIVSLVVVIALIGVAKLLGPPTERAWRRTFSVGLLQALVDEKLSEVRTFRKFSSERHPPGAEVPRSAVPGLAPTRTGK